MLFGPRRASFTGSVIVAGARSRRTDTLQSKNAVTCGFGPDAAITEIIAAQCSQIMSDTER